MNLLPASARNQSWLTANRNTELYSSVGQIGIAISDQLKINEINAAYFSNEHRNKVSPFTTAKNKTGQSSKKNLKSNLFKFCLYCALKISV